MTRFRPLLGFIAVLAMVAWSAFLLSTAEAQDAANLRKITASLHDGHSFAPQLRRDGKWLASGVGESGKGDFQAK